MRLEPAPFFALRTPLLPFDALREWGEGLDAARAEPAALAGALIADRGRLRGWLRGLMARPEVREALFIASPSLEREIAHWNTHPSSERGQRIERALVRYVARMAGRPTPFGLFAGCGVGSVGGPTNLRVPPVDRLRRRTRLDQGFVTALTQSLGSDRALRRSLRYRANESIYEAAGRLRYFEARGRDELRAYHLVAVDRSDALDAVLRRARDGASFDALVEALVALEPDAAREEAAEFIDELIDAQLLLDGLAPAVIGDASLGTLRAAVSPSAAALSLGRAESELRALDEGGLGRSPAGYAALADALGGLSVRPAPGPVVQVDLVKPESCATLDERHVREILRGAELLRQLAPPRRFEELDRFKSLFRARFEEREVPLLAALDEDIGVGFGGWDATGAGNAPLLEGLPFPRSRGRTATDFQPLHALLLRKWERATREGAREIVIDAGDLEALQGAPNPDHPAGSAVLATLFAADPSSADFRVHVRYVVGASGASLLARFADADPELLARVREQTRREEAAWPDVVFAEVAHLPAGRVGNILLRPRLRRHELRLLGRSESPDEAQITPDDLLVSLRDDRILLRSRSRGREVIPRLTTAHNFADRANVAIYRFLGMLQFQGVHAGLSWDWGPLAAAEFLPRVVHGRVVLSRASWHLGADRLRALAGADGADARFAAVQELRHALGMPRFVLHRDGDNELPVDLDNALSVEALASDIGKRASVRVDELFPGEPALVASGPEGRYVHEIVLPFTASTPPPARVDPRPPQAPSTAARCPPGSEWLYAQLSCGPFVTERVLEEVAAPVARAAMRSGAARAWFFVRYDDPSWHLRLRVRGDAARLRAEVQPALEAACAPLLADGTVSRIALDTYERELERYGGEEGMLAAEAIFHADSEMVVALLPHVRSDPTGDRRWQAALLGMRALLEDFALSDEERAAIVRGMRASFAAEFPTPGDALLHRVGGAYRRRRGDLEALLEPRPPDPAAAIRGALAARSALIGPVAARLQALARDGALACRLSHFVAALLHMHANRWFSSAARAHELVLYDFLDRTFDARRSRRGKAAP